MILTQLLSFTAFALSALTPSAQTPTIGQYEQPNLEDATFTARVYKADQNELQKINHDFGQSYRFQTTTFRLKEPFMLRVDAKVDDTTVTYVINGTTELIRVPRLGVHTREDLSHAPGRRQTFFDFGVLTPSLFESLYDAKFVRTDRETGDPVFDVTYQAQLRDTSRSRIWIDKEKHYIVKREWYNQSGRQLATFYYSDPTQASGVWMPSKLEVKNVDDQVAGITGYNQILVNTPISDAVFAVR